MVRNRARKQHLRATRGADAYVRSARLTGDAQPSEFSRFARLITAFADAGWPVVIEREPDETGAWIGFPGPVSVAVAPSTGKGLHTEKSAKGDPGDQAGSGSAIPTVEVLAPTAEGLTDPLISFEMPGNAEPSLIVEVVAQRLAEARVQALAMAEVDSACGLCDEPYAAAHLLPPTVVEELSVCPACVFDGDLLPAALPQRMALAVDELFIADLAMPAGWAAVTALLACAAGPRVELLLSQARIGWPWEPLEHWSDPEGLWIWLPPKDSRPTALAGLGPGASLRAIIAVTEAAHPQLRAEVSRQISEQMEISPDDLAAREYPVEQLWPAIVAYAVALGTDAIERYDRRPPIINVTDYFEEGVLTEHFEQMRSVLDPQGVVVTLEIGVKVLVERLGWTWSSNDEFA